MGETESMVERAVKTLGKGFDLSSDFRLKFCKGEERLVLLNEQERREVRVPGFRAIKDVSVDIKCDKGDRIRYQTHILTFTQMSEFFNQKCSIPGKIPSGYFNAMFGFDGGSWGSDAANTKYLGVDGYYITLCHLRIDRYPLALSKQVLEAVPTSWDPLALARFIEKYGTHIVVGLGIGGNDVVVVRQDASSNLGPSELKKHLNELGDQLFTGTCNFLPKTREQKNKVPQAFDVFGPQTVGINSSRTFRAKDGISVTCLKRGGDTQVSSHYEWVPTIPKRPDAVHFSFIPITSLLKAAPGTGFLSHAVNLYLRYKPPISELAYFLDFQAHRVWAPIHSDLPLGPVTNRTTPSPALTFNLMGPKLYVNTTKVTVGKRPVTGMRLFLEGMKCNRLAIHLQHLLTIPTMLESKIESTTIWSEEVTDDRFFEAINGKRFSHVCTMPVKYNPKWRSSRNNDVAFIVTGAQLHVKKHDSKSVLHLKILFSMVSNTSIVKSNWAHSSSEFSQTSNNGFFSAITNKSISSEKKNPSVVVDSSVFPRGPPMLVQTQKMLRFVDTSQLCKGPQDSPGHWLVTGARLVLEEGKIGLWVKFSLLSTTSRKNREEMILTYHEI